MFRLVTIFGAAVILAGAMLSGCGQPATDAVDYDEVIAQTSDDIIQTLSADEQFSTLVAAIDAADLTEKLRSAGPFTVFAPTNEAFDRLPAGTLDELLKPENKDDLVDLLEYHLLSQELYTADMIEIGSTTMQAYNAKMLELEISNAEKTVNGVPISAAEIVASNGVIHPIESVLLPE